MAASFAVNPLLLPLLFQPCLWTHDALLAVFGLLRSVLCDVADRGSGRKLPTRLRVRVSLGHWQCREAFRIETDCALRSSHGVTDSNCFSQGSGRRGAVPFQRAVLLEGVLRTTRSPNRAF